MKNILGILALIVFCGLSVSVNSYKILGIVHIPSRSHYIAGHALMQGLAEAGHECTLITALKGKNVKNYEEIHLENSLADALKESRSENFLNFNNLHPWELTNLVFDASINYTRSAIRSKNLQNFLREDRHYDVVIAEVFVGDAMMALGHYFNAPVIGFSTTAPSKWSSDLVGLSHFSSHVPNLYCGYSDKMNFWQRIYNSLAYWYEDIATELYYRPKQQKLLEQLWPNKTDVPTMNEILRNVSLVFVNSQVAYASPQPMAPNLIEIGGIHINKSDKIYTEEVQRFLDEAKDGAIFFSLGSNVKLSSMDDKVKTIIANSFAEFPNVRILLKNEEDFVIPSHKPADVLVKSWFNQHEILSHPNLRLFITHGGLLSTTETVYFGKPVVGIPVFFDQNINMKVAESKGYAETVPLEQLTEQKLKSAIRNTLTIPSYAATAKLISERFHGQMNTPMETAIHWVEHIAKYKGAPHLRSIGLDLPFYIYYNLDCWAFFIVVCSSVMFLIFVSIKKIAQIFAQKTPIKTKSTKNAKTKIKSH